MSTPIDHTIALDARKLPDFSEYLSAAPDRIAREESGWSEAHHYERNARQILSAAELFSLGDRFHLLELGCGSGLVPTVLPDTVIYAGIDNNPQLLVRACARNGHHRMFYRADIRTWPVAPAVDLVASFAVLKHFGLHEWEGVFAGMLSQGRHGLFNIQLAPPGAPAYDDGTEFHHIWVTAAMVERCVHDADRRVYRSEVMFSDATLGEDAVYYIGPKALR